MSENPAVKLSQCINIDEKTSWELDDLDSLPTYPEGQKVLNSTILKDFTIATAWVTASLIKTGFNTRKTTKKGVRRMTKSLRQRGYMQSNAVVIYPGTNEASQVAEDHFTLSNSDIEKGIRFLCADGMHRVRCVTELAEAKKNGEQGIVCGDMVGPLNFVSLSKDSYYLSTLSLGVCNHSAPGYPKEVFVPAFSK